jgi:hypothetical protein
MRLGFRGLPATQTLVCMGGASVTERKGFITLSIEAHHRLVRVHAARSGEGSEASAENG